MDDLFVRQIDILKGAMGDYRRGALGLNSLIQRIEGVSEMLDMPEWKDAIYPIVLSLETINAFALGANKGLTEADTISVENSLLMLEKLIGRFQTRTGN